MRHKLKNLILVGLLIVLAWAATFFLQENEKDAASGRAQIIDGDSLRIHGQEIRLKGIDAPEGRQNCYRNGQSWPCGREATKRLQRFIQNQSVSCKGVERDRYDRLLGVCMVGNIELNQWMVHNGWAVSYHNYPRAEQEAREGRRGIWNSEFERPNIWRRKNNNRG